VVHNGTSDSGHYYTFIKDREGNKDDSASWYEFNDTLVNHFDPKDIPAETFGGENENWEVDFARHQHDPAMQQLMQTQGRVKTKSAYILIYERECFIDQDKYHEFVEDINVVMQN
jgi:ubiquitin carboxyl-terminal hydrolase 34